MKNRDIWRPSKFVLRNNRLLASRNPAEMGVGSRLMGDIIARFYQEYIPRYAKGKLLDLGCGAAPLYGTYKEHCTDVLCVDWINTAHTTEYVDIYCDLTEPLPLQNESFDTIILSDVLEHIPTPELLLKEMFRVLRVNGSILINVPFYYWIHESPHDYYRFTEFALKRLIKLAGFDLVEIKSVGGVPEIVTDVLAKFFLPYPGGKCISISLQHLTSLILRTKIGKRISAKTGTVFPLGYFLVLRKPGCN